MHTLYKDTYGEIDMFDIWDENNELVRKEYKRDNYIINEYDNDSNMVAIYFSSNGIYFPNTEECFRKRVIEENRYEWQYYKIPNVKKEIFFRDIYKSWYITGINDKINSIDKIVEFIKSEIPENASVVTVGNSSGGYAAALIGTLIGASWIFDFSGQNTLMNEKGNPFVKKYLQEKEKNRYFELNRVWKTVECPPIFYFYSGKNFEDVKQFSLIKDCKNIYTIGFRTKTHERTMYNFNLPYILAMNREELVELFYKFSSNKLVGRFRFSVVVSGWNETIRNIIQKFFCKVENINSSRTVGEF